MVEIGHQIQKLMVEMERFADGNDSLLCPSCLFFPPFLSEIRNKRENTIYSAMQKVDTFRLQNKKHYLMQIQEGNWQNWHTPMTWDKMPSPPKNLVVSKLTRLREREEGKGVI